MPSPRPCITGYPVREDRSLVWQPSYRSGSIVQMHRAIPDRVTDYYDRNITIAREVAQHDLVRGERNQPIAVSGLFTTILSLAVVWPRAGNYYSTELAAGSESTLSAIMSALASCGHTVANAYRGFVPKAALSRCSKRRRETRVQRSLLHMRWCRLHQAADVRLRHDLAEEVRGTSLPIDR